MENRPTLLYEDTPLYDLWLKLTLGGILALTFVVGLVLLFEEPVAAWIMFGATLFDALLLKAILPRRFQIFHDRLRIVLGSPFALNIPLSHIEEARPASGRKALAYWGQRFATATRNIVEIVPRKGLGLVISPTNRDTFLEQLNQAIAAATPQPQPKGKLR